MGIPIALYVPYGLTALVLLVRAPAVWADSNEQAISANRTATAVAHRLDELQNAVVQGKITLTPTSTPTVVPTAPPTPTMPVPTETPTAVPTPTSTPSPCWETDDSGEIQFDDSGAPIPCPIPELADDQIDIVDIVVEDAPTPTPTATLTPVVVTVVVPGPPPPAQVIYQVVYVQAEASPPATPTPTSAPVPTSTIVIVQPGASYVYVSLPEPTRVPRDRPGLPVATIEVVIEPTPVRLIAAELAEAIVEPEPSSSEPVTERAAGAPAPAPQRPQAPRVAAAPRRQEGLWF